MLSKLSKIEWAVNAVMLSLTVMLLLIFKPPAGSNFTFYTMLTINVICGFVVFYNQILWLVPAYLSQKKYMGYIQRVLAMLACTGLIGLSLFAGIDATLGITPEATEWSLKLAISIPLVFIAFNILIVMPLSFLYLGIKGWFKTKKVSKYAEVGLHLFLGGVLWIYLFQRLPYWDIHQYPAPFYASLGYASLLWLGSMALFYGNALWFIPKYLAKKKPKKYLLSLVALLIICILVDGLLASQVRLFQVVISKRIIEPFVMSSFWLKLILILPASFFYRFAKDWISSLMAKKNLALAELAYLKGQINPHFLFNTLNGLYAGAISENSPITAEGISKLSNLMRYALTEKENDRVTLKQELDYIEDYVSLQLMRLPEATQQQITFKVEGFIEDLFIAPMLLITFIENCFQHGISADKDTSIAITIRVEENTLLLMTKNPVFQDEKAGNGIGLANTIKRLDILYDKAYTLKQFEEKESYITELTIQLD